MFVAWDGNFQLRRCKANKNEDHFVCDSFFLADTLQDHYNKTRTSGNRSENNQCNISIKIADSAFKPRQLSSFNEIGLVVYIGGIVRYILVVSDVIAGPVRQPTRCHYDLASTVPHGICFGFLRGQGRGCQARQGQTAYGSAATWHFQNGIGSLEIKAIMTVQAIGRNIIATNYYQPIFLKHPTL